jgi:F0F1-type ATP synthase assembly protein I
MPMSDPDQERTMREIEKDAEARSQRKIELARAGLREAVKHLSELVGSPLLGASIGAEIEKAHSTVNELVDTLERVQGLVRDRFRKEA